MKLRPSTLASLAVALIAVVGLGACTSNPSTETVARDIIESLQDVDDDAKQCMTDKIDEDYTNDQLDAIGNANIDFNSARPDTVAAADEDMQAFIDDLRSCITG